MNGRLFLFLRSFPSFYSGFVMGSALNLFVFSLKSSHKTFMTSFFVVFIFIVSFFVAGEYIEKESSLAVSFERISHSISRVVNSNDMVIQGLSSYIHLSDGDFIEKDLALYAHEVLSRNPVISSFALYRSSVSGIENLELFVSGYLDHPPLFVYSNNTEKDIYDGSLYTLSSSVSSSIAETFQLNASIATNPFSLPSGGNVIAVFSFISGDLNRDLVFDGAVGLDLLVSSVFIREKDFISAIGSSAINDGFFTVDIEDPNSQSLTRWVSSGDAPVLFSLVSPFLSSFSGEIPFFGKKLHVSTVVPLFQGYSFLYLLLWSLLLSLIFSFIISFVLFNKKSLIESAKNTVDLRGSLVHEASDAVIVFDANTLMVVDANRRAEDLLSYSKDLLTSCSVVDFCVVSPDSDATCSSLFSGIKHSESNVLNIDLFLTPNDGSLIPVEASVSYIAIGDSCYLHAIFRDIRERILAKEALLGVNRSLRMVKECNELMIRSTTEGELFSGVCNILVHSCGYSLAWGGVVSPGDDGSVSPFYFAGKGINFSDFIASFCAKNSSDKKSTCLSFEVQEITVTRDISSGSGCCVWSDLIREEGIVCMVTIPVLVDGLVVSTLHIYSDNVDAFNDVEILSLEELSTDISFGISSLRAHRKIVDNRNLLDSAESIAHIGSWKLDLATGFSVWSDEQFRILGFDASEVVAGDGMVAADDLLLERIHVDDALYFKTYFLQCLDDVDSTYDIVYRIILGSGEVRMLRDRAKFERDKSGKPVMFRGTTQDVTNQILAQNSLEDSEKKYRLLVENQSDLICKIDNDGRFLFVSPSYCDMFGKSEEYFIGNKFPSTTNGNSIHIAHTGDDSLAGLPHSLTFERQSLTSNGLRWISWVDTPIFDDGKVVEVICVGRDVTDKRYAEDALRDSESLLEKAQSVSNTGHWVLDLSSGSMKWSKQAMLIFSWENKDLHPSYVDFVGRIHFDDKDKVSDLMRHLLDDNAGGERSIEYRIVLYDGSLRFIYERCEAVIDSGSIVQIVGSVQDITERRESEYALHERNVLLQAIFNSSPTVLWSLNASGVFTLCEGYGLLDLGLKSEDLIGESLFSMCADKPLIIKSVNEALSGISSSSLLCLNDCYYEMNYTPLTDLSGKVVGAACVGTNVTEILNSSEELKSLHEHVSLLLESTGEGIYGLDSNGICTFINSAASDIFGCDHDFLVGKSIHKIVSHTKINGDIYRESESPIFDTHHNGQTRKTDSEIFWTAKGESFPVEYSSYPVFNSGKVTGAVIVFRDVGEKKRIAKKMKYLASHDWLTGLINRREFEDRLSLAIQSSGEIDYCHALCYMDLDQFKVVNDTCGHNAGDRLLQDVSALLRSKVRGSDTLARLGGDEFGVLLHNCSLERAREIAEDLREAVNDFRFSWEEKIFEVGVSIGMVPIVNDSFGVHDLTGFADAACYVAKDHGRNRVHVYQGYDGAIAARSKEMQWVHRITSALADDRFSLNAQLIAPIGQSDNNLMHYEVLLTMIGESGDIIPPMAFIPSAERYNIMPAIDRWVISQSIVALKDYEKSRGDGSVVLGGQPDLVLSINISGTSFNDKSFSDYVLEQFEANNVSGESVIFEMTETAAISNLSMAIEFFEKLRKIGCRFALDDFGTGLSSFGYLKTLPVDYLKIDGSFVKDMVQDPVDHAMVSSINQIGQVMGLKTIAEFVESEDILNELLDIGVDYAQGMWMGKPTSLSGICNS